MDVKGKGAVDAQQAAIVGHKIPFNNETFRWAAIEPQAYKFSLGDQRGMGWRGVTRYTLAGPPKVPAKFELRYFELAPAGYSSFEKHRHVHFILVLRGRGKAVVDDQVVSLALHDLLYVPPNTPHRWINDGDEPFGFLCPVDAERDPPQPLSDEEWEARRQHPAIAPYTF